ncbi:hypothetical protein ACHQM5_013017 [Ranunculus cassubicifolius]
MEELKKAYADIIFETTKEAALKIMVAENKANRYKKEMIEAKEEALNMLIRFKSMADSKFAEIEILSLCQRRKIVELEAQVHKSEAVVNGLSSELKEVKDELQKLNEGKGDLQKKKHTRVQSLDKIIANRYAASNEDVSLDNQHVTSSSSLYYPCDSGCGPQTSLEGKDTTLHQLNMTCSSESGDALKKIACQTSSPNEKYSVDNYDLPSIIRRIKKPRLYRPGCTQRIHALERNQLIEKLSSSVHIANKSSRKKNKIGNTGQRKKNSSSSGGLLEKCHSFRVPCRKNGTRFRKPRTTLWTMKAPNETTPSNGERCGSPDKNITKSSEDPSVETEETNNRVLDFTPLLSFNTTNTDSELECAATGDEVLKVESDLRKQENQDAENLNMVEIPSTSSDTKDGDSSEMIAGDPAETVDDKFHKFTFRRKRKKISLSDLDKSTSLENNTLKKSACEMQRNDSGRPKSSLTVESCRDDRRLMLVARQLISLKDKKSWK